MKIKLMFLMLLCGTVMAQDFDRAPAIPLEEFGLGGFFEPTFMGETFSDHFFNSFPAEAATNGLNYMGQVGDLGSDQQDSPVLTLEREHYLPSTVILALTRQEDGRAVTFMVSLADVNSRAIDLSGYESFDNLYLISSESFGASITRPDRFGAETIDIQAPVSTVADTNYCVEKRVLAFMWGCNASGTKLGNPWLVYFHRFPDPDSSVYWSINVEVTYGIPFHKAQGSSTYTSPACKLASATTKKVGGSRQHYWYALNGDDLDDVLFYSSNDGFASCYSGCNPIEYFCFSAVNF